MSIKISTILLILVPMMMIQQGITSETASNQDIVESDEVMNDPIVEKITVFLGRYTNLSCPDLNGTARYEWLLENECGENCKQVEFSDNMRKLRLKVTSKTIGNYTCECKVADCKSYTFQLYFDKNRDENVKTMEDFIKRTFIRLDTMNKILNYLGYEFDKFYHYEEQKFSTDFQKIRVKNGNEKEKILVLSCFDKNNIYGDKYTWLKNNAPLKIEKNVSMDKEREAPGAFLVLKSSAAQRGNYTCICKDTSCVPYKHTYKVTVTKTEDE